MANSKTNSCMGIAPKQSVQRVLNVPARIIRTDIPLLYLLVLRSMHETSVPNESMSNTPPTEQSTTSETISPSASSKSVWSWCLDLAIIIAFSVVICQSNQTLMLHTIIPPESNDAMHLSFLSSYDCAMRSADSIGQAALITWTWPCFYPPSSYLITYLYSLVFGSGVISALTSLTVFIPILVTSIYGINRQRYGVLAGICGVATAAAIPQGLLCCCHYPSDL